MTSVQTDKYYETYWTAASQGTRGARFKTEHGFLTPHLRRLLERQIPAGASFLDVGCGDGRTAGVWATETGRNYVGVDVSAQAVSQARAIGLDARVIEDAAALPFDDNSFDYVTCIEVFEHLFAPQRASAEILRILRPGGVFVATTPNVAYWRNRLDLALFGRWNPTGDDLSIAQPWRDPHIRFFGAGTLRRMLLQSGFRQVRVEGHEGTLLGDIPGVRRIRELENPEWYHRVEVLVPAVFAKRLAAISRK